MFAGIDVDGFADEYVFKENNPFLEDLHSFAKAKSLFRHGILSEAVYALEAEVRTCYHTTIFVPFVSEDLLLHRSHV